MDLEAWSHHKQVTVVTASFAELDPWLRSLPQPSQVIFALRDTSAQFKH